MINILGWWFDFNINRAGGQHYPAKQGRWTGRLDWFRCRRRVHCPTWDRKNTFLGDHRFQCFVLRLAITLVIISAHQ